MLKKYNRYRVLKVFLDSPAEDFGLREISRLADLAPASVLNYLGEFEKEEIITKSRKKGLPVYRAQRENEDFIFYKKISILYELHDSGLIEYLWQKLAPKALILYGSYAKGESSKESDIDIFVIGKERQINLEEHEKKIGAGIHLIFNEDIKKISNELKNNLINGIVLKGYLKIF
ncbi:MAG: nucleotidyltransferase domain-containing protein [Candidatus Pacearchaeota archaeon]